MSLTTTTSTFLRDDNGWVEAEAAPVVTAPGTDGWETFLVVDILAVMLLGSS